MSELTLKKGLEALGFFCSEKQIEDLKSFSSFLMKWNKVYNLTAIRDEEEVIIRHILDSASLALFLRENFSSSKKCLDVGSGGGLPGIPCAILCPEKTYLLTDPVGKKAAFLKQASLFLKLKNLEVFNGKVQDIKDEEKFDLITSRAFSDLETFVSLTKDLISEKGTWLAMKAKIKEEEIEAVKKLVRNVKVVDIQVPFLDEERKIIVLSP